MKRINVVVLVLFALLGITFASDKAAKSSTKEVDTQDALDNLLLEKMGDRFDKKRVEEILVAGPNKTYACR